MKVPFIHCIHDGGSHWSAAGEILEEAGLPDTDENRDKIGRPFYEIGVKCEIDTDTFEVTILGAERIG